MDITNCRSMELFKNLGIDKDLRDFGVPQDYSFDVLFSTGLSEDGDLLCKWDLASPNAWKDHIKQQNDGSYPREPYQRISQALFEARMKTRIQEEPLIDLRFGLKLESYFETDKNIVSCVVDVNTGAIHKVQSDYLAGCDGANSQVRKSLGCQMIGGPVPGAMYLVHFKSSDLTALHRQGQFWHIFFVSGSVIISQDEVDTWTIHLPISLHTDWKLLDPLQCIYKALGGIHAPCPIKVDQILVCSFWRPNICIADRYASGSLRVFLCGDAAHQNIPTGGYGMNTAVGDCFDLGWKLAAVIRGWGGESLLRSYEAERKPVARTNIERSGVHHQVHQDYVRWVSQMSARGGIPDLEVGSVLRQQIIDHINSHDGENKDHGIELGYRYNDSPVIIPETATTEPEWNARQYVPSTWPGARAPHVFLSDGETSTHDLFGPNFTLFDFSQDGVWLARFSGLCDALSIPLKTVQLSEEEHVHKIWQRDSVLIRPDGHVAWRSPVGSDQVDIEKVLRLVSGHGEPGSQLPSSKI
ncbi:FAD binding domain-containing protein [Colletotrichum gloeosporioides Cg-14]|uniref:FAD binding domain-containing protein n=1 Tax=Colletotrichum gloeosporioides (strain Cg-14) TaxID=1237896 RepID=T0M0D0_COLGC|nr:FAD binding domain-containing protein [Colletotrichum gloeosporioides Cg-14]